MVRAVEDPGLIPNSATDFQCDPGQAIQPFRALVPICKMGENSTSLPPRGVVGVINVLWEVIRGVLMKNAIQELGVKISHNFPPPSWRIRWKAGKPQSTGKEINGEQQECAELYG